MRGKGLERVVGVGLAMFLVLAGAVAAQQTPTRTTDIKAFASDGPDSAKDKTKTSAKRPVRPEDYGQWESLGFGSSLSPDGRWLAYAVARVDGDGELRLRMLATEATETITHGQAARFSKDGKWLAYSIGVSEAEREKAEKTKEAPKTKLGLRNLVSGEAATIDQLTGPMFSDDGKFLAMRGRPIKGRESSGADLVVRNLATGVDTNFGNVSSFAFNDDGPLLAMIIDAEEKAGNGVQVYDAATGHLRARWNLRGRNTPISPGASTRPISQCCERTTTPRKKTPRSSRAGQLQARPSPAKKEAKKFAYDFSKDDKFPKNHRVVDFAALSDWSDDGQTVFFGVKAWEHKPAEKSKSAETKKDEPKKEEAKGDAKKKALRRHAQGAGGR